MVSVSAMAERRFLVRIEVDEEGAYVAECLSLPGCISQGKTEGEAIENVRDAIKGYLASLAKHGEKIPKQHELHLAGRVLPPDFKYCSSQVMTVN